MEDACSEFHGSMPKILCCDRIPIASRIRLSISLQFRYREQLPTIIDARSVTFINRIRLQLADIITHQGYLGPFATTGWIVCGFSMTRTFVA